MLFYLCSNPSANTNYFCFKNGFAAYSIVVCVCRSRCISFTWMKSLPSQKKGLRCCTLHLFVAFRSRVLTINTNHTNLQGDPADSNRERGETWHCRIAGKPATGCCWQERAGMLMLSFAADRPGRNLEGWLVSLQKAHRQAALLDKWYRHPRLRHRCWLRSGGATTQVYELLWEPSLNC